MSLNRKVVGAAAVLVGAGVLIGLGAMGTLGQPEKKSAQPTPAAKPDKGAAKSDRVGDPYPLDSCPISGGKLGSMGDPVVKTYDGREVRFCCDACPPKFEKDKAASWKKVDEKIVKDQKPLYPLQTSVVSGKSLSDAPDGKAIEYVWGNRLFLLAAPSEKDAFAKDGKKYLEQLDKAVVDKQGKDYPLKTCPVSNEKLGGEGEKPVDTVIAGRLVRTCCKDCVDDLMKEPAKTIAKIDEARKGKK